MIGEPIKIKEESILVEKAICILDKVQDLINEKITAIDSIIMFFDFLPIPAWIKDISGKVKAVNSAYKSMYPITSECGEYKIGFPSIILKQYAVNDLWVQNYMIPRIFEESAPIAGEPNRVSKFLKFPVFSSSGILVGVAGIELSALKENK